MKQSQLVLCLFVYLFVLQKSVDQRKTWSNISGLLYLIIPGPTDRQFHRILFKRNQEWMSVLCGFCFTCATWRKVFTPSDLLKQFKYYSIICLIYLSKKNQGIFQISSKIYHNVFICLVLRQNLMYPKLAFNLPCSQEWLWTSDPLGYTLWAQGSQAYAIKLSLWHWGH